MTKKDIVFNLWLWKLLANLWTFLTMILFLLEFFSNGKYSTVSTGLGIIYLTILGIFATIKEFERWQEDWQSKYLGEVFIIIWTVLLIFLISLAFIQPGVYKIPSELTAVYLSVLGIFAVTNRSKFLHQNKFKKK